MKTRKIGILIVLALLIVSMLTACSSTTRNVKLDSNAQASITSTASTQASPVNSNSKFEVTYLDVGQGDSELVQCDGKSLLIDGGTTDDSQLMYTYLQKNNIDHLDYVICTHVHEDHVGGLSGALSYAKADTIYCSAKTYDSKAFKNFVKILDKQGKTITIPKPGDSFQLGSALVTLIGPINASKEINDNSIVTRIDYGKTSLLFTGDAGVAEEKDILNAGYKVNSTVLKVGHHGSDTASSEDFIKAVSPQYAVISDGKNNEYGLPDLSTLNKLKKLSVTLYRTDLQGDIKCTSDGTNVTFSTSKNTNANVFEATNPKKSNKADN